MTSAFDSLMTQSRAALAGRAHDDRVRKATGAGDPADVLEGVDVADPGQLNGMYDACNPATFQKAAALLPDDELHAAASVRGVRPEVAGALRAATIRVQKELAPGAFPDSTPSVQVPARPADGPPGKPGAWLLQAPPVPQAPGGNPGSWVLQPSPGPGAAPTGSPGTWLYRPATEVVPDADREPIGVGDQNDNEYSNRVQPGDLVAFRGPGGSVSATTVSLVTRGRVVGPFAGSTVEFPADRLTPHSPV